MGGDKSGSSGKAHDYYGTIAGVVCAGPVDELVAIIIDGKLAWPSAESWAAGKDYVIGDLRRYAFRVWRCTAAHTSADANAPPDPTKWTSYSVARTGQPNPYPFSIEHWGQAYLYWGTADQALDTVGEKTLHDYGHPPYRRQAVLVLKAFLFGRERTSAPNVEAVVRRIPNQAIIDGASADLDADGQANPKCVEAALLSDPVFGLGQPDSFCDATTWQALADELAAAAASTYLSPFLDRAQTARSILANLLAYYDGWVRFNAAGAVESGHFLHDAAPPAFTDATTIDYNDLIEEIQWDANGWPDTANQTYVKFSNRDRAFKADSAPFVSSWNLAVTGDPRPLNIDRPFITRPQQASTHAAEWGKIAAEPGLAGTLAVRAEKAASIGPGDLFLLTHDAAALSIVCRCTQKTLAKPPAGRVTLRFQSERGIGQVPYHPTRADPGGTAFPLPEEIEMFQIVQPPPSLVGGTDFQIAILAARASALTIGLRPWLQKDDGALFYPLGEQRQWSAYGTLHQDYTLPGSSVTASRARAANVATIVTGAAHRLSTGQHVQIMHVSGADYDADDVTITVVDATTFTYANVGADEVTTADVDGEVIPLDDDESETLQLDLDPRVRQPDIDKISQTQSADAINDNNLLIWVFKAADDTQFEIMTVRAIRLDGGVYKLKVRRGRFGTPKFGFSTDDRAFILYRHDLVGYTADRFGAYAETAAVATFRLQSFNAVGEADLSDPDICPDIAFTFSDPYAPTALWQVLQVNGADIADFTLEFLPTDEFEFTLELHDANGDLTDARLVARLGATETLLWEEAFKPSAKQIKPTAFKLTKDGEYRIFAVVRDASGRVSEVPLAPVGGGAEVTLKISALGNTVATPVAIPPGDGYPSFPQLVTLTCSTAGATIEYQLVTLYGAIGGSWTAYAGPISVPSNRSLYSKATKAGMTDSAVVRQDYWYERETGGGGGYQLP